MKTFEQQAADAIRNLTAVCIVLAVGLLAGIGLASWGLVEASNAGNAAKAGLVEQTANRARNVAVWCGSINQGRDYDRAFVQRVTRGHAAYRLGDLPCARLERKTLASTKPH